MQSKQHKSQFLPGEGYYYQVLWILLELFYA